LAGIFKGLGEGWKTAKPLCVGSIPTRASSFLNDLYRFNAQITDLSGSSSIVPVGLKSA
jgi:hypothetical protein